jgi:hypothetical protein
MKMTAYHQTCILRPTERHKNRCVRGRAGIAVHDRQVSKYTAKPVPVVYTIVTTCDFIEFH